MRGPPISTEKLPVATTATRIRCGYRSTASRMTFPRAWQRREEGIGRTNALTNTGTTPLTIHSISLIGANPGDFTFEGAGPGNRVVPGASLPITMTFSPKATGIRYVGRRRARPAR